MEMLVPKKGKNLFLRFLDKVNFFKKHQHRQEIKQKEKENNEIIQILQTSKGDNINFGIHTMDACKVDLYYALKKDPTQKFLIAYADIDGLKDANIKYQNQEEFVDNQIAEITIQLKRLCQQTGCQYYIGKPEKGDEILIGLIGTTEEQDSKFKEKSSQIQTKDLTISIGYTTDVTQGIEEAIRVAEKEEEEVKQNKKIEVMKQAFMVKDETEHMTKLDIEKYKKCLRELVRYSIASMRIYGLSLQEREEFKENFIESIELPQKEKERILAKIRQREQYQQQQDIILAEIPKIEAKLHQQYADNPYVTEEFIQDSVKAEVLKKHPVMGIRRRYFTEMLLPQQDLLEQKDLENCCQIDIDISKIKEINGLYGHMVTDREVDNIGKQLKEIMKELKIKPKIDIIGQGISRYTILINSSHPTQIANFVQRLQQINTKLAVNVTYKDIQIDEGTQKLLGLKQLWKNQVLKKSVTETQQHNEKVLNQKGVQRKVQKTEYMMWQAIQLVNSFYFQAYKKMTEKTNEEILEELLNEELQIPIAKQEKSKQDKQREEEEPTL